MYLQTHAEIIAAYALEHASLMISLLGEDGVVLDANKYTYQLFGRDIVNENFLDLLVDFHHSFKFDEVKNGEKNPVMLSISTGSGIPQTLYFTFVQCVNGVLVFGEQDIDESKHLRENLMLINNELSNVTRELHKNNAELQQLMQLKNKFLGMAAHDLRSPASQIKMCANIITDKIGDTFPPNMRELMDIISQVSDHMINIISNFLTVSAIDAGVVSLEKKETDFAALVKKNVMLNNMIAARKKITITLQCETDLPHVMIDGHRIDEVLTNLIGNAIKFSYSGAEIEVTVAKREQDVVISVRDHGVGMSAHECEELFKPFSKNSSKGTAGEKGTGLGLFIAQKIVTEHGGRISVESCTGEGTVFYFTLPFGACVF